MRITTQLGVNAAFSELQSSREDIFSPPEHPHLSTNLCLDKFFDDKEVPEDLKIAAKSVWATIETISDEDTFGNFLVNNGGDRSHIVSGDGWKFYIIKDIPETINRQTKNKPNSTPKIYRHPIHPKPTTLGFAFTRETNGHDSVDPEIFNKMNKVGKLALDTYVWVDPDPKIRKNKVATRALENFEVMASSQGFDSLTTSFTFEPKNKGAAYLIERFANRGFEHLRLSMPAFN